MGTRGLEPFRLGLGSRHGAPDKRLTLRPITRPDPPNRGYDRLWPGG